MKKYGFAILGCGNIAPMHAKAIEEIDNARLVAVCDTDQQRAEALAEKFNATAFTDYQEMLKRDDIDIVNNCLPSALHEKMSIMAAQAGKHVVVEKPLDITLEKCDRIIEACEQNNVKLAVIFPSRFKEASMAARKAIESGRIGRITLADAQVKWYRSQKYYDSGGWRGTWEMDGGGALMNQSIHYIDLMQSFMGPVKSVFAYCETLARDIEVEDTAVAVLKFENGAIGTIEGTTSVYPGLDARIGIHGDKGSIILDGESIPCWEFEEKHPIDDEIKEMYSSTSSSGAKDPTKFLNYYGHKKQLEDLVDAIYNNREPMVNGHEGRKAVEIISAIYQSAKSNKPVTLPLK